MKFSFQKSLFGMAAMLAVAGTSQAAVIFSEGFESPTVTGYVKGSIPNNGKWVGTSSDSGFGWDNKGLINEDGGAITTPYGNQAFTAFYNNNSGITTSAGAIGLIAADTEYSFSFNVADANGGGATYTIRLIAFDGTANSLRDDVQLPIAGATYTIIQTLTGSVSTNDFSESALFTWDSADAPALVGFDLAVQLVGSGNQPAYDNVSVAIIPEPTAALLGSLGFLLLLRRRR